MSDQLSETNAGPITTSIDSFDLHDHAVLYVTMGDEVRLQLVRQDQTVTTIEFAREGWLAINQYVAKKEDGVILGKHWPVSLEVIESSTNSAAPKFVQVITPVSVRLREIGEFTVGIIEIPFETWRSIGYIWNHQRMVKEYP